MFGHSWVSHRVVFTNLFSAVNRTEEMRKQFTIPEKHLGVYHNYISHSILSISVPAGLMTQQQDWWFIFDSRQKEQVLIVPSKRKMQSRVNNLTQSFQINYNTLRFHQNTPVAQASLEPEAQQNSKHSIYHAAIFRVIIYHRRGIHKVL